jgi:hypothetical protein
MTHTGYSLLDHRRNENISEKFKVDSNGNKLPQYKQKWLNTVSRIEGIRYPNSSLTIRRRRRRRRRPGQPSQIY